MRFPSLPPVAGAVMLLGALAAFGAVPVPAADDPAPPEAVEEVPDASPEEDMDEEFLEDLFGEEGEEDIFGEDEGEQALIADPLEGYNRAMFWVNDKFYFYLLKPVARGWRAVSPRPVRRGLGHFFSNFFAPVRAANCLLQGKVDDFGNEIGRFMVNSTVGILGFWDQAKRMTGIGPKKEDFGQTLGVWGFGQGFYFVLPLLGPSSPRDTTGFVADFFLDPFYYVVPDRAIVYVVAKSANYVNATSLDADTYEGIKRQALDPYVFLRNAYVQKRAADVAK